MLKILVSGAYPLSDYVKKEIERMRQSVGNLNVQEVDSKHLLKNPYYINNEDILICGVVLAERLKKLKVRGHIVPLRVQTQDFIQALARAATYGDQICIINYYKEFINDEVIKPSELQNLFGITIKQYTYRSTEHADEVVKQLSSDTKNIIVGSGLSVELAERYGLLGVLWYGEETIQLSVSIAFDILRAKMLERSNQQRQSIVMENFQDGVISLNRMNRIMHLNQAAIEMLSLRKKKSYEGELISTLIEPGNLLDAIESSDTQEDKVIDYKKKTLIITNHSIEASGNNAGQIIFLSDVEVLQEKEQNVRRTLNKKNEGAHYTFSNIIGQSYELVKAKYKAKKFAQADANVLILGESGTGKELFAQSIHNASRRKDQPFVAINCAAIPENLVESEFFGYSDGAFTGAIKGGKPGLFEVAHNGTIFLDEIGELPLSMQAKLLRALQEKQVRRVGSVTSIPIDVRVISATNVNLLEEIQGGDFRMDLYYRIAVLNLFLPNLNQRKDDLGLLMQHYAKKQYPALYDVLEQHLASLLPLLQAYEWRGNVREFENTLERFFAYIDQEDLTEELLVNNLSESIKENNYFLQQDMDVDESFEQTMKNLEQVRIQEVLEQTKGNKQEAAKLLGISRSTLWRKINESNET